MNIHDKQFTLRLGQTLEIAIYKALTSQTTLTFLGGFSDLDSHDDDLLYTKIEPPAMVSGTTDPLDRRFDFLIIHPSAGLAGIEAKNTRQWLYPEHTELRKLLNKACRLDSVPVLIARRFPFITFNLIVQAGGLVHQVFNQLFPSADVRLAQQAAHKDLLGFHDIRVGNEPDARLLKFIHTDLPQLLPAARETFNKYKPLLLKFSESQLTLTALLDAVNLGNG